MSINVKITANDSPVTVTLRDADKKTVIATQEIAATTSHDFLVDDGVSISAVDENGQETDIALA